MPSVYRKKDTKYWWCWGHDVNGKRWDESTKQTDKVAAVSAAREIERRYAADAGWKAKSTLTLNVALEGVLKFQRERGRAEATTRATGYHARHLNEHLGANTMLGDITLSDTTKYLRKRLGEGADKHTISKELKTLAQAMRRAEKLGKFRSQVSPGHFIPDELGSVYKPRERWLTRDEYVRLLAQLGDRYREADTDRRDYVVAWCHLGVRKSELFDVRSGDYDEARFELRVRGTKTDSADRLVPAPVAAREILARRCRLEKPFPEWDKVTRDLARACSRAGMAAVTPNDLRRTFCSWLCQAGVPERVCAELMGHSSTVMVRAVYGHLDREGMAAAVSRLDLGAEKTLATAATTDVFDSGDEPCKQD